MYNKEWTLRVLMIMNIALSCVSIYIRYRLRAISNVLSQQTELNELFHEAIALHSDGIQIITEILKKLVG